MLETLNSLDTQLFFSINAFHNAFFDFIMYWISNRIIWVPLYLFLIYILIKSYKKQAIVILLSALFLFVLSDQTSVIIKNVVQRLRPCHNTEINYLVHLVNGHCGGKFGFISSHATNSFALVAFCQVLLYKNYKKIIALLYVWAVAIIYSRVYLGVHYPLDVIVGALFGFFLGFIFAKIAIKLNSFSNNQ